MPRKAPPGQAQTIPLRNRATRLFFGLQLGDSGVQAALEYPQRTGLKLAMALL